MALICENVEIEKTKLKTNSLRECTHKYQICLNTCQYLSKCIRMLHKINTQRQDDLLPRIVFRATPIAVQN